MKKKIVALLMGVAVVIITISFPAYALKQKKIDSELLPLLGIMTGDEVAEEYVSRAELARYAVRFMNISITPKESDVPIFTDTEGGICSLY